MSRDVEFAKQEIIAALIDSNTDVGDVLNPRVLQARVMNWNPKQVDALDTASAALVAEGILEVKETGHCLTAAGLEALYPPAGDFVREAILRNFRASRARAGSVLNFRALANESFSWNPKQKRDFKPTLSRLEGEGIVERKGDNIHLTQLGYDEIY